MFTLWLGLLFVTRKVADSGKENEKLIVYYTIKNESPFTIKEFFLSDHFSGTSESSTYMNISTKIKRNTRKKIKVSLPLNEGFGEHHFESIDLVLTDALGIFKFTVKSNMKRKVLIYPQIQKIIPNSLSNNDETYLSGDFEIHKKGISPNFYGIRHYQFGDPMKFIEKGSALIFITPLNQGPGLRGNIEFIKKHYDHFSEIHIYCVDAFKAIKKLIPTENKEELFKYQKYANDYFNTDILPLRNLDVKVFKLEVRRPHEIDKQMTSYIGDLDVSR